MSLLNALALVLLIPLGCVHANEAMLVQAGQGNARYLIRTSELLVFTLPWCPHCEDAKEFLSSRHIDFREIDLSSDEGARIAEVMSIPKMAPVFAYKHQKLFGFTPYRLTKFLEQ